MLEVRNLAFAYGDRKVLRDVSFVVSPGEIVSVVGANGAGKTTLMRILANLLIPESGQILEDGFNAFTQPLRYRRQLGFLSETPALYEDMRVKEFLKYRAILKGEAGKRIRRRVSEVSELCRITDYLRTPIEQLSVGLKKRVAFADALLLRPRILILDDFLSGLDVSLREDAGELLSNAAAFSSVIITGHELEELSRFSARMLVLKDGVIASTLTASGVEEQEFVQRVLAAIKRRTDK